MTETKDKGSVPHKAIREQIAGYQKDLDNYNALLKEHLQQVQYHQEQAKIAERNIDRTSGAMIGLKQAIGDYENNGKKEEQKKNEESQNAGSSAKRSRRKKTGSRNRSSK